MIDYNLDRLLMLSRKGHTLISPAPGLTFNILSVMSRSHFFSHNPFLPIRSWFIGTPLYTTRLHPFIHDPFTLIRLWSVYSFWSRHVCTFLSQSICNLPVTTICTLWSRPVCNFSVTIHSQPLGHDPFATSRSRPFAIFQTWPFAPLSIITHLHAFGHNPFVPFLSWSRSIRILSVRINFTSFRSGTVRTLSFMAVHSLSITIILYIFGHNTFTPFQS